MFRQSSTGPRANQHGDGRYQAENLPSTRYTPPNDRRRNIGPFPKRTGEKEKDMYASGIRRPDKNPSTRHVRFEPASAPLPSRPFSPSPLPRTGHTSVDQNVPVYQRASSIAKAVPERLRVTSKDKGAVTPTRRIEELTRENGLLRQELLHYKETHAVLINFLHINERLQKGLRSSLEDTVRRLAFVEQPLRDYWGLDSGANDEIERMF